MAIESAYTVTYLPYINFAFCSLLECMRNLISEQIWICPGGSTHVNISISRSKRDKTWPDVILGGYFPTVGE